VGAGIGAVGMPSTSMFEIAAESRAFSSISAVMILPGRIARVVPAQGGKPVIQPMSRSSIRKIVVCSRSARSNADAGKFKAHRTPWETGAHAWFAIGRGLGQAMSRMWVRVGSREGPARWMFMSTAGIGEIATGRLNSVIGECRGEAQ